MSNTYDTSLLPPAAQTHLKAVEDRLAEYVLKMAPGRPITEKDGAFQQRQLWHGVMNFLLKQETPVFLAGWSIFLDVVAEHRKDCFSPGYIHRFRESTQLTLEERRNFERLIHLAVMTSDPKARTLALKQIDMHQILARLPSEDMRQKIIAFYQL